MLNSHNSRMVRRVKGYGHKTFITPLKPLLFLFIGWLLLLTIIMATTGHCDQINPIVKTASWYGTTGDHTDSWKHTTTANGEKFNEQALTAASWKYPLGTLVKVTNLYNGKSVIVRINDRGPGRRLYAKGRVIDLTRGAFEQIADLKTGVIKIKEMKWKKTSQSVVL